MLYKVTPMMAPPEKAAKKTRQPGEPRKKRKSAVYDHEGQEVLITLMCLKCRSIKPLAQFGLRKMADGAIRNQPWCRPCRSGAGLPKPKEAKGQDAAAQAAADEAVELERATAELSPEAAAGSMPLGAAQAPSDDRSGAPETGAAPVGLPPA